MSEALALKLDESPRIHWRLRRDIQWTAIDTDSVAAWIATDPLTRKNFRIGAEEKFLLSKLDGNCDIRQLHRQFAAKFPPKSIDDATLMQLVSLAIQRGLLIGNQGERPLTVVGQLGSLVGSILRWPYSLIFARFSIGNPEKLLRQMQPWEPVFFSGRAVMFLIADTLTT